MCGLFGVVNYDNKLNSNDLSRICNALARESEERGSHATGIAYINKGKILIEKAPKPAHRMNFRISNTCAIMGHTRHSTQGSERKNFNNHPFMGYTKSQNQFALAHNGILYNDKTIRSKLKLPKTKIETDSYIAVQLIGKKGEVSLESLKYMSEKVQGSFSFSVLDYIGNLYIVKGDSPVSMLLFKDLGLYVYASTDDILWRAITNTVLLKHIQNAIDKKDASIERIIIDSGEIIKIDTKGTITKTTFRFYELDCLEYRWWSTKNSKEESTYVSDLKSIAAQLGYSPEEIDEFIECGYSCEEIEEILYQCDNEDFGRLAYLCR